MKFHNIAKKYAPYVVAVASMASYSVANAALTAADLAPMTTEVESNITVLTPYAIGILVLTLGLSIALSMFKKFTSKAAG
jgi:hypothetical protein